MNINRFCFHTGGLNIQEENSPAHKQDWDTDVLVPSLLSSDVMAWCGEI